MTAQSVGPELSFSFDISFGSSLVGCNLGRNPEICFPGVDGAPDGSTDSVVTNIERIIGLHRIWFILFYRLAAHPNASVFFYILLFLTDISVSSEKYFLAYLLFIFFYRKKVIKFKISNMCSHNDTMLNLKIKFNLFSFFIKIFNTNY